MEAKKTKNTNKEKRNISHILIFQNFDEKNYDAHFVIEKDGEIKKELDLKKSTKSFEKSKNAIVVVINSKDYTIPQQKALMNVLYQIEEETKKQLTITRYDSVYNSDSNNPNINLKHLINLYIATYKRK